MKKSAEDQYAGIGTLTATMTELSRSTGVLNETVARANGMKNITVAVGRINAIMNDIESIVSMVTAISEQAGGGEQDRQ